MRAGITWIVVLVAAMVAPTPAVAASGQGVKTTLQWLEQKPSSAPPSKLAASQDHVPDGTAFRRSETAGIKPGPIPGECHRDVTRCTIALANEGVNAASFFRGKTLKIVSVHQPGGANDRYSRLVARHIGKHIPGKPRVLVVNIPGRGGRRGTSYVYNVAKSDGLTIIQTNGLVAQTQFLDAAIDPSIAFDITKFNWLGLANGGPVVVAVHKDSPIQTLQKWLNPNTEPLIVGCTWPISLTCRMPLAINNLFGKTTEIVAGYLGSEHVRKALRENNVDGVVWRDWERPKYRSMIADGDAKIIAYMGSERHAELEKRDVPLLDDYISNSTDLAVLKLLLMPAVMPHAWAAPPNTPQERVEMLQTAFRATLKDPAFLADAERMDMAVNPKSAEWLKDFTSNIKRQMTPEVVSRGRRIVRTKPGLEVRERPEKPRPPARPSLNWNDPCNTFERHGPLKRHRFVSRPCV